MDPTPAPHPHGHGHDDPRGEVEASVDVEELDSGLAAERTELAWGRSLLALVACAAAMAKGLPNVTGNPGHPVAAIVVLGFSGLVWLAGLPYARARSKAGEGGVRQTASSWQLLPLAVGTAGVGVAAIVIDLVLPR